MDQNPDAPDEHESEEQEDSISFENDAGELDDLEQYPTVSCYFECIFGLKEMYLYRGVLNAYLHKFSEAVSDFNKL